METQLDLDYSIIINTLPAPIIICDGGGNIFFVNDAAAKAFGYDSAEMIGKPLSWLIPPSAEGFGLRKDGTSFPVAVQMNSMETKSGLHFSVLIRDTSTEKTAQQEFEQFAYAVSHDLQQQTRNISNYIELIENYKTTNTEEDVSHFLTVIASSSARLNRLIADLLAFSRVGRNKQIGEANCKTIIHEVLTALEPLLKETRGVIVQGEMPVIRANVFSLREVFLRLITNALVFRRNGVTPEVRVAAKLINGSWQFEVRDNGIGIEEKNYEKIFSIFYRLHAEDEYPGTGAGLAICKKLVEAQRGKIYVQSEPGIGSAFYFTVPQMNNKNETGRQ